MSLNITIKAPNIKKIIRDFERDARSLDDVLIPAFRDISLDWQAEAKKTVLISPTKAQYEATLKGGKSSRTDFNPGGLERSIKAEHGKASNGVFASVFVATNAEGAKYAVKIHDERGKTWQNLGPGSIKKSEGRHVADKYIERPRDENIDEYGRLIERRLAKHFKAE